MDNIDFEINGKEELLQHLLKILPEMEAHNTAEQLLKQPSGTVVTFFGVDNTTNFSVQKQYRVKIIHD